MGNKAESFATEFVCTESAVENQSALTCPFIMFE